ncbi:TonB-dependent receptor [Planctobacterium marinum]|uniref:TonB-dependent receptor n=1 Tax=Planctobacterium marinum TaxID=1631968 RepID=UPI001E56ED6C|nr:TonB-dependent receptor [Planctobacterium marinum]MCC2605693.1 TonB-dependent receptor [Planctobacterium marinum]
MKIQKYFRPSFVAMSVAAVFGLTNPQAVLAQETVEDDGTEVIEVTGIRGSLIKSMDIKRSSDGVVDAISAEDIGKFPDTNLAESLQRITGVAIDRQNNEGSRVTVRGWGPEFNMITLNGRQMPAANLSGLNVNTDRSFDFANLASESVSGVEVYKTGKAHLTTGGIGSTINIQTHKPFNNPGFMASIGAKAISDDTRVGNDITPEVSGIISNTFNDDKVGISLVASRSERDNYIASGQVTSGWNTSNLSGQQLDNFGNEVYNAGSGSVIFAAPQNYMYVFEDFSRVRTNAQLTLQFAPSDKLKATLDYTYSELEQDVGRQEFSAWFGAGSYADTVFTEVDSNGVVSPLMLNNRDCCDLSYGVGAWGTTNQNDSIGLNLEYEVNDNLVLTLDAHSSEAEAKPKDHRGSNNVVTASTFRRYRTTVDFSQYVPEMQVFLTPTEAPFDAGASGNEAIDPGLIIASGNSFRNGYMKTEIDQVQLNGEYVFDAGIVSKVNFGVSHLTMNNRTAFSLNQGGDWGGMGFTGHTTGGGWNSPAGDGDGNFSDGAFTVADLNDLSGDNIGANGQMVWVDFDQFSSDIAALYAANPTLPGNVFGNCAAGTLCTNPEYANDLRLEEEQLAFYVQANLEFELGDMPSRLIVGVRHEATDVKSESLIPNYTSLSWLTANELILQQNGGVFAEGEGDYSHTLPNLDFSIDLTEDLIGRISVSKTIARPAYDDLQAGAVPASSQARTFDNSTAASGDPNLEPFESDNFDISLEYYYGEGSYAAIGYYKKDVKNFIGTSVVNQVIYPNLVNPASGERFEEAQGAVVNPGNAAQEIRQYYVDQGWVAADGSLTGDLSVYDPLDYTVTIPVNQDDASVDGFEFAAQHIFGESGFGIQANYTTVDGDVTYDNTTIGEDQFALLGLSDTANLVAFYEKDALQIRLAYNWRDKFLNSTTGGNGQQEPAYTESYAQLDLSVSYSVTENLTLAFEGINITEENRRAHARGDDMIIYANEQSARYAFGVRYDF